MAESSLTALQRKFLSENFNETHGTQGKTDLAAHTAREYLDSASITETPEFWAELAQQSVVLTHAAAYMHENLAQAMPYLIEASQLAQRVYPLGALAEEADQKSKPWQTVYGGGEAGAFETFRTTVKILSTIRGLLQSQANMWAQYRSNEMSGIQDTLLQVLGAGEPGGQAQRASLLMGIETKPYQEAALLLPQFQKEFPDPHAQVTVLAQWFGRSWQAGEYRNMIQALKDLTVLTAKNPNLAKQSVRDVAKSVGNRKERRVRSWSRQLQDNPKISLDPVVEGWNTLQFAATGSKIYTLR